MKLRIPPVLPLVLLVIALQIFQACKHEQHDASVTAGVAKETPQASSAQELKIISVKSSEELKNASISTETAQVSGDARAENFNKAISDFVARQVKTFKGYIEQDKKGSARPKGERFELNLSYEVKYSAKNLISILYNEFTFAGGAHPNNSSTAFNYDLERGRMLALADLFMPSSDYLKVISDYCIAELKKRKVGDDDWIRKGAGAKPENYARWNIVPEGLLVTFDSYQVAAYVEGPQEVIVPFAVLKGIIKPDGPLGRMR